MKALMTLSIAIVFVSVPALAAEKNVEGCGVVYMGPTGDIGGDTACLEFAIYSYSVDNEPHMRSTITLRPDCIVITGVRYEDGGAGYDYETNVAGYNIAEIFVNSGTGLVPPGMILLFVDIETFGCPYWPTAIEYDWDYIGSGMGAGPHIITGTGLPYAVTREETNWSGIKALYK